MHRFTTLFFKALALTKVGVPKPSIFGYSQSQSKIKLLRELTMKSATDYKANIELGILLAAENQYK